MTLELETRESGSALDWLGLGETTMVWRRLTRGDSAAERELARTAAARLPILLSPELEDAQWAHRRLWNVQSAAEAGVRRTGASLIDLAAQMDRILVTRDSAYLDDTTYPPEWSPGVLVLGRTRRDELGEALVTLVSLLGPVAALYRHVKVWWEDALRLSIDAPAGSTRRVRRRFQIERDGLPMLQALEEVITPPFPARERLSLASLRS